MSGISTKMLQAAAGGGGPEGAWDLSYAYYDPPESLAWDVSTGLRVAEFSISAQESDPQGIFFKPDGLKMYVVGRSGDDVNEYNLSTAWDISSASYLQNFSVSAQEDDPQGIFFKPDGTKMYIVGDQGNDVNEYDLSTAWDISTASYLQNFSIGGQTVVPEDLFFKSDGTKMYIVGGTLDDSVYEYDLSTAWDVSTASYLHSFFVGSQDGNPFGLSFKSDGSKMYISGTSNDTVYEYNLSTAWDVSSATYFQNFDISAFNQSPTGIFFDPSGGRFFTVDSSRDSVTQYTLGGFNVAAQESVPEGLFFKPDGTKMYITGSSGDDVNEYNLSTAWDVSSASFFQNFSVSSQDRTPQGIFFKPDGTKMYVVGNDGDDVNEYDLSTAWDISTASYLQNFSVAAQENDLQDIFFKSDGLKMYIVGDTGNDVNEYNLSTAWDVSSASYLQNFSVATQEGAPHGIFFKPDGLKMYVVGINGDSAYEYDLSTAWDISTASYLQNFSLSIQNPTALFFKDDGTQMFILGSNSDSVYSYTLGPQE